MQTFDSREVVDAHGRLKSAYHPHPVALLMIANILHERQSPLAEQIDVILETLGTRPVPRDNWIFLITASQPQDPFVHVEGDADVLPNLTCVDLVLPELADFVEDLFTNPIRRK